MVAMLLKPFSTVLRHVAFMEGSEPQLGNSPKTAWAEEVGHG